MLTVVFTLILISSGPLGLFVSSVTTDFTFTALPKASFLQNLTLLDHTSAHITKTELIYQTTVHFCLYSKIVKKKQAPKIKTKQTTPGLSGKSRQELVDEANQRRLEKIKAAKEREEVKQQKLREDRERRTAKKKEQADREKEKQRELQLQQEKLKAARDKTK